MAKAVAIVAVSNVTVPGRTSNVNVLNYTTTKDALLTVLLTGAPGLS